VSSEKRSASPLRMKHNAEVGFIGAHPCRMARKAGRSSR
jgi:hypothetical protein